MEGFGAEEATLFGVESIAIDPGNPDVVYAAVGKYTWDGNGHILKSTDRGKNWTSTAIPVPMAANGDFRWAGERLIVDPNNGEVVYFGSRESGLWRTANGGTRWERLVQLSATGDAPVGIPFVLVDSRRRDASGTKIGGCAGCGLRPRHLALGRRRRKLSRYRWAEAWPPRRVGR